MNTKLFDYGTFSVGYAARRDVGEEWNTIVWNRNHTQIQYHRLYYLNSGSGRIKLFDSELELSPGHVYFLPAFSISESRIIENMNKYFIHFQAESPYFELYRYISGRYCVKANPMSEAMFETVVANYNDNSPAARLRVQGAVSLIMADFLGGVNLDNKVLKKFSPVLKFINENYNKNIRLSELAAIMNVSTMYFSNFFKSTFNISPKQYILNKRLEESQRLLLETNLSVKEIAYKVGFENENYFSEFFSAKTGIGALKFRNRDIPSGGDFIL
jgi:AraC-like DNA-binding protein